VTKPVRVLIVDDSETDAFFLRKRLERAGYAVGAERVDTAVELRRTLDASPWDLVICDYHIPGFGALEALKIADELGSEVPFIVVSGVIGEEAAADCMRAGAHDFVLKDSLSRLVPAIERELAESKRHAEQARMRAELARSEELLLRSEKLRGLGEMAAGISHDLKNLLNPLSLHIQLIERAIAKGQAENALESLREMRSILDRGVTTVEQLRDYGKVSHEKRHTPVGLVRLVREARSISHPRMVTRGSGRHRVVERLASDVVVVANAGEVVTATVNLIVNAVDAMPSGGTITLEVAEEIREVDGCRARFGLVRVSDDGPGMSDDLRARIFEPFFTTKGHEGTGMGLAMVRACMERHRGAVELTTAIGRGTTFTLFFPVEPPATTPPPPPSA
jgi:signal transduction histidine kinase